MDNCILKNSLLLCKSISYLGIKREINASNSWCVDFEMPLSLKFHTEW